MALIKSKALPQAVELTAEEKPSCESLLAQLSDENPETRRWAARDMLHCEDASEALVSRLKIESELSVREVILTALIHLKSPNSIAGLVECLRSEDPSLRNEALEAMKQLPDLVAPIMVDLLNDEDPDVRIFSVNILESLRHPDVESWLIGVVEEDPHVNVCATALDLLSEVGTEAAMVAIPKIKARFADEPYIQFAADLAFKRITEC